MKTPRAQRVHNLANSEVSRRKTTISTKIMNQTLHRISSKE